MKNYKKCSKKWGNTKRFEGEYKEQTVLYWTILQRFRLENFSEMEKY